MILLLSLQLNSSLHLEGIGQALAHLWYTFLQSSVIRFLKMQDYYWFLFHKKKFGCKDNAFFF